MQQKVLLWLLQSCLAQGRVCLVLLRAGAGEEPAGASREHGHGQPVCTQPGCCHRLFGEGQPYQHFVPVTWLFFNAVAFGSFNFYLNICFPAEVLDSAALASWSTAKPLKKSHLLEMLTTLTTAGSCLLSPSQGPSSLLQTQRASVSEYLAAGWV